MAYVNISFYLFSKTMPIFVVDDNDSDEEFDRCEKIADFAKQTLRSPGSAKLINPINKKEVKTAREGISIIRMFIQKNKFKARIKGLKISRQFHIYS